MKKTQRHLQASSRSKQMLLLPELYFNPKWPSKNTHAYQALCLMLNGYAISGLYFQDETASQRLPANIFILRKLGWDVKFEDKMVHFKKKPYKRELRHFFFDEEFLRQFWESFGGAL